MTTVTLEQAQAQLPDLIDKLAEGEEVVITRDDRPVAQLIPAPKERPRVVLGRCKGMLTIHAEDDDHLADFAECMP